MPGVHVVDHPLVQHHLTCLRDATTPPEAFRRHARQLVTMLAFDATRRLQVRERPISTPLCPMTGRELSTSVVLVPILRAGLAMVDPFLELIPQAHVRHLGLYRDEETARPVQYYNKLPADEPNEAAFILDPMLATGGSATAALEALTRWGVKQISLVALIAATTGVEAVQDRFPQTEIHVCGIDPELNSRKFIVPGLGDAGDRMFNTV